MTTTMQAARRTSAVIIDGLAHFSIADDAAVSAGQIDFARARLLSIADAIAPAETGYKCEPIETEQLVAHVGDGTRLHWRSRCGFGHATQHACAQKHAAACRRGPPLRLRGRHRRTRIPQPTPTIAAPETHAAAGRSHGPSSPRATPGFDQDAEYGLGMPEAAIEDLKAAVLAADQPLPTDNSSRRFSMTVAMPTLPSRRTVDTRRRTMTQFHGPCRQGLTLRVARLAARLGYTTRKRWISVTPRRRRS